jgi:dihydrodipicolinate reductase
MVIRVCLAGATGWAGSELARAIVKTEDLALVAAVSRKHAGRDLGEVGTLSLRLRSIALWALERPEAPLCPERRFTPFVCRVT